MQITLTHPTDTTAQMTIVLTNEELSAVKQQVLTKFQASVKVQGFREGKAPLPMVEKQLEPSALQTEFLESAINQTYVQALDQENLRPAADPQIEIKKFVPFTELEYTADVPVIGDVKLPDYKKIKVSSTTASVSDEEVEDVVQSLQKRIAEKKDVDRPAALNDQVFIDFKGVDDKGEPVAGADGKDYPLTLGSNTFIPGFEDNVVGMSAGDDKTFTLTFPKDYGVSALAGRDVTFTVSATKVQEVVLPAVDDAFAAASGPFKTVDELKADIKVQLQAEKQQEHDREFNNELVEKLASQTTVAIPDVLVDQQVERLIQEEKQNLAYRGQTWQEHLDAEGTTEEEHTAKKRVMAAEQIKASLALAAVAEAESLAVTPEELEIQMQLYKGRYTDKQMQAELEKPEARREIASRILTEKTLSKLKEYATQK